MGGYSPSVHSGDAPLLLFRIELTPRRTRTWPIPSAFVQVGVMLQGTDHAADVPEGPRPWSRQPQYVRPALYTSLRHSCCAVYRHMQDPLPAPPVSDKARPKLEEPGCMCGTLLSTLCLKRDLTSVYDNNTGAVDVAPQGMHAPILRSPTSCS